MSRPITLFTGQWADLPFEEVAQLAAEWGYDGLEIACSGDHLDVERGAVDDRLHRHAAGRSWTATACRCSPSRRICRARPSATTPSTNGTAASCPARVWGDGDPEGVRQRAADAVKNAARTAARLGVSTVVGFTGSSIWKYIAMFPPASGEMIDAGYQDFADRWNPILDVFDEVGVRFAHEVHPSEIAYDYYSTARALEAIGHREAFGINWDPSHMVWQNIDPVQFIWDFRDRIYHVDCKDTKVRPRDGRRGCSGPTCPGPTHGAAGTSCPPAAAMSTGRTASGCSPPSGTTGPISIEWEDAGMDRLHGAPEALAYIRSQLFDPPATAFDAAFSQPGLTGVGDRVRSKRHRQSKRHRHQEVFTA